MVPFGNRNKVNVLSRKVRPALGASHLLYIILHSSLSGSRQHSSAARSPAAPPRTTLYGNFDHQGTHIH